MTSNGRIAWLAAGFVLALLDTGCVPREYGAPYQYAAQALACPLSAVHVTSPIDEPAMYTGRGCGRAVAFEASCRRPGLHERAFLTSVPSPPTNSDINRVHVVNSLLGGEQDKNRAAYQISQMRQEQIDFGEGLAAARYRDAMQDGVPVSVLLTEVRGMPASWLDANCSLREASGVQGASASIRSDFTRDQRMEEQSAGGESVSEEDAGSDSQPLLSVPEVVALAEQAIVVVHALSNIESGGTTEGALGSGFHVGNGILVTSHHVVRDARAILVKTLEGKMMPGTIVAFDRDRDVALVQVSSIMNRVVLLGNSEAARSGETVVAFGAPEQLAGSVSTGIISARRQIDQMNVLQHTSPISPGSSGGPLVDLRGRVVGVNTAFLKGGQNLNFAVAVEHVQDLLRELARAE